MALLWPAVGVLDSEMPGQGTGCQPQDLKRNCQRLVVIVLLTNKHCWFSTAALFPSQFFSHEKIPRVYWELIYLKLLQCSAICFMKQAASVYSFFITQNCYLMVYIKPLTHSTIIWPHSCLNSGTLHQDLGIERTKRDGHFWFGWTVNSVSWQKTGFET